MLQSILEERFGIKAHYETREIPIYELVTDKAGFRLHPAAKGSCTPRDPATMGHAPPKLGPGEPPYCGQSYFKQSGLDITVDLRSMTLEEFAGWLLHGTDRLIYDKTGIQDKYDFHLEYSVDETMARFRYAEPGAIAEFPSLANALQKFGLKLVPGKGPGRFLRIDHVERPSEN
jgi:bla regulator protein blaR1